MSKVWFAIPSARPAREANQVLHAWHDRGYGVAIWRDSPENAPFCNLLLTGAYPGYAQAVNALAAEILHLDPECEWIVCGGDDTLPDPRDPNEIAAECKAHFRGTLGVMQPTGDRWAGGSIDRIAGSPWMGREWCQRANGGQGPLWPEFLHMYVDECLLETARRCGAFWQRPDVTHMHRHYLRDSERIDAGVRYTEPPAHLKKWNSPQHWREMQAIFERLRAQNFAPCMPTGGGCLNLDMVMVGGLEVPDLRTHFKHLHWRPMPHSMGVPVASDFADRLADDPVFGLYKKCGLWTQDEAAILFNVAAAVRGRWLDLGCHTGWTSAHQAEAGCEVVAVDNMLPVAEFAARFSENTGAWNIATFAGTTEQFFRACRMEARFRGAVIDADHERPWPLMDAQNAVMHLEDTGIIMFHDFIGRPVREAVDFLINEGFKCKVYWTAHMVACCWRGEFTPPNHQPLPGINWQAVKESMPDFAFDRCE